MLTEQLVGVLRGAGLSVNAGTINHAELLGRVLEFAPDAIGTDRPHELRAEAARCSAAALSGQRNRGWIAAPERCEPCGVLVPIARRRAKSSAASNPIVARAPEAPIRPAPAADEDVPSGTARQSVVSPLAPKHVATARADQHVPAVAADDPVAARSGVDSGPPSQGADEVATPSRLDPIAPGAPDDHVVARSALRTHTGRGDDRRRASRAGRRWGPDGAGLGQRRLPRAPRTATRRPRRGRRAEAVRLGRSDRRWS